MKSRAVTPGIIDKQLVDIGLDGGVDTHTRQESVDWTKFFTTLENMTNDNAECLVKRAGVSNILGTTVDDVGTTYLPMLRALRLQNSVGFVGGTNNSLYVPNSSTSGYIKAGRVPDLSVIANYPVGACNFGDTPASTAVILGVAASTKYSAVAWSYYNTTPSVRDISLAITDRATGNCVRTYTLSDAGVTAPTDLKMVLVDDRYLHVYFGDGTAGNRYFFQLDTSALPATLSGVVKTSLTAAGALIFRAVYAYSGGSCIVTYLAGSSYAEKFNTSGASTATATYANFEIMDADCDGTTFYLTGYDSPFTGSQTKIGVVATLAVTSTITDATIYFGAAIFTPTIACDTSGNITLCLTRPIASLAGGTAYAYATDVYYRAAGAGAYTFIEKISGFYAAGVRYHPGTGRFYCLGSQVQTSATAAQTIRGTILRNMVLDVTAASGGTKIRPVCLLDEMVGLGSGSRHYSNQFVIAGTPLWGTAYGERFLMCAVPQSVGPNGSTSFSVAEMTSLAPDFLNSSDNFTGGGVPGLYDGLEPGEAGILSAPSVFIVDSGGGVGPGAGLYNYFVVFEYVDASGQAHYSRSSLPIGITMATANAISVQVCWPSIFGRTRTQPIAARIYRTKVGGTVYYLSGSVFTRSATASGTSTNGTFMTTYTDTVTDTVLGAKAQPYRQPGANGTALDRGPGVATRFVCRHKDRVWFCSGSNLYYSSFFVSGEAPWFNAQFSFPVYGGTGPITAMASMDGQLVVFKKDAIFVIDGDGPPENGGTGNEFSPPRRMLTEFGCTDPRSLVPTPEGLMYRSARGLELLTRSLQVTFVGERVQDLVSSFPHCTGAVYDQNRAMAMFCMASALSSRGVADTAEPGIVLVYDTALKSWHVYKYGDQDAVQDIGFGAYPVASSSPDRRYFILKSTSGVMWDTYGTSFLDGSTWVPLKMESGWIKLESHQDRIRVSEILLLAKKVTSHNITISVAYDYSDTYTHSVTFKPNEINAMDLEQLCFHVPDGAKQAVRFKIEDSQPSDTTAYPVGTGAGCEILAVSVKVGKRGGGAKLPDAQRG